MSNVPTVKSAEGECKGPVKAEVPRLGFKFHTPGPGQYLDGNLDSVKTKSPRVTMPTAKRETMKISDVPGPGAYGKPIEASAKEILSPRKSPAAVKFASSTRDQYRKMYITSYDGREVSDLLGHYSPGPSQYCIEHAFDLTKSSTREEKPKGIEVGPGSYSVPDIAVKRVSLSPFKNSPRCCFGTAKREPLVSSSINPGPGAYTSRVTKADHAIYGRDYVGNKSNQATVTIGRSKRKPLIEGEILSTPGVGSYKAYNSFGEQVVSHMRTARGCKFGTSERGVDLLLIK